MTLAILGAGAWGTALAIALARAHPVRLWARDATQATEMAASRRNARYLPDALIPAGVLIDSRLDVCLDGAHFTLIATPTAALRSVLKEMSAHGPAAPLVWACKGFERGSGLLPHQILEQEMPGNARAGAFSGPSFAAEVARGQPTALTVAAVDAAFARDTARMLHQSRLRVYYSDDLVGVEIGGAVKNVMAIATGICDGLGFGLNARAALITRGLAEVTRLGTRMGGRAETFMGLAGAGDLILTCTGDLSRNRRVGLELARGKPIGEVLDSLGHVAEGVESTREVLAVARKLGVDMPVTQAVCGVLFESLSPQAAADALLSRDPREER
jgi:glycerol-3-phosphate dehydrogenase (NAD(P)+)